MLAVLITLAVIFTMSMVLAHEVKADEQPIDIADTDVSFKEPSNWHFNYSGDEKHVIIDDVRAGLVDDDYTFEYYSDSSYSTKVTPVNVGTYYVKIVINEVCEKYTGAKELGSFNISPLNLRGASATISKSYKFTGQEIEPNSSDITVTYNGETLIYGTDYIILQSKIGTFEGSFKGTNTYVGGENFVYVTGTGNYGGYAGNTDTSVKVTFNISPKDIGDSDVLAGSIPSQTYTGSAITPTFTLTYNNMTLTDSDYTVTYSNNINAGTATVTITGKGNYSGTKTLTFNITKKDISAATVTPIPNQTYTGKEIKPEIIVTVVSQVRSSTSLILGTDYTVSYANNINVGEATVTITGIGSYSGTKTLKFNITQKHITIIGVTVTTVPMTYTGKAITLTKNDIIVKLDGVTLIYGTDYTLSDYRNNINTGTATFTINGKGNYTGTISGNKFTIEYDYMYWLWLQSMLVSQNQKPIVTLDASLTYNSKVQTPAPVVKSGTTTLKESTDYTLTYDNNTNAGTATVTVKFKGSYSQFASQTIEFTIKPATLTATFIDETISLGETPDLEIKVTGFVNDETAKTAKGYTAPTINVYIPEREGTFKVTPTGGKATNYTFKYVTGYVTVTPPVHGICYYKNFTDLGSKYESSHNAIDYVVGNGYFKGVSANEFNPSGSMNRAMIPTVLGRISKITDTPIENCGFTDVDRAKFSWATAAIKWGYDNGIVKGTDIGKFTPEDDVTIEQAVTFIYRYVQFTRASVTFKGNYDISKYNISEYAAEAMTWAYANSMITETELANANQSASRILFAEMLYAISNIIR